MSYDDLALQIEQNILATLQTTVGKDPRRLPGGLYVAVMAAVSRACIRFAMERTGNNKLRSAEILGISRTSTANWCKGIGLGSNRGGRHRGSAHPALNNQPQ